jgi:hypothetical protein
MEAFKILLEFSLLYSFILAACLYIGILTALIVREITKKIKAKK